MNNSRKRFNSLLPTFPLYHWVRLYTQLIFHEIAYIALGVVWLSGGCRGEQVSHVPE